MSRASRPRIPVVLPVPPSGSKLEREFPVAVVIGASRGLGLLMARELDREGFRVVIAARHQDELDRAAEELAAQGLSPAQVALLLGASGYDRHGAHAAEEAPPPDRR